MKKHITVLFLLFIVLTTYSQQNVFETDNVFLKPISKRNESFTLSNQENGDLMLILSEKVAIKGILLDSLYQEKARIDAEPLPSKYKQILSYQIDDQKYSVLFSDNNNSKFGVLQFDISKNTCIKKILDFKLKNEKLLGNIIHKNNLFLLSITKETSTINIYKFDNDFIPIKKTYSLRMIEYPNRYRPNSKMTLYRMIYSDNTYNFSKIESHNPITIEKTSKKVKLYKDKDSLILSVDSNPEKTHFFFLNLETLKLDYKNLIKPSKKQGYDKNNTLLFNNNLFLIASSNEKMKFQIRDFKKDTLIKEYSFTKKDSIPFKNSSIIQEGGTYVDYREMEKTAKYLRKISSGDLGISVYKKDSSYTILLGGNRKIVSTDGLGFSGFGNEINGVNTYPVPGGGSVTIQNFSNPVFNNYQDYSFSNKSTYIKCLFDKNFNHKKGEIPKNIFDKIKELEDSLENPTAINIFSHYNKIYYGFYNTLDKTYQLVKFDQ